MDRGKTTATVGGWVDDRKQPSAASAGYRLLNRDELIQSGDEFLDDDTVTWVPVGRNNSVAETWMIGMKWDPGCFKPVRRKR